MARAGEAAYPFVAHPALVALCEAADALRLAWVDAANGHAPAGAVCAARRGCSWSSRR